MLTYEIAHEFFEADFEKGTLIWKERDLKWFETEKRGIATNLRRVGTPALSTQREGGYHFGSVFGKTYRRYRVLWLMYYGSWPEFEIDHIDGNPSNDSISNLRDVPHKINQKNRKMPIHNSTGIMGVYAHSNGKGYVASIKIEDNVFYLGYTTDLEQAKQMVEAGYAKHSCFHENHGKR